MLNFRFDDVLDALDMKPPALRRWLQLGLVGNTAKGKGREGWVLGFTAHDIAILALVKAMTEFGVPVAAAHRIAVREMREHAGPWSGDEAPEAFWRAWSAATQITISRKKGAAGKPAWAVSRFEDDAGSVFGAHLTLYPHALIRDALQRAIASVEARTEKRSA